MEREAYKYIFSLTKNKVEIERYRCEITRYGKNVGYHLKGTGRLVSNKRFETFSIFKSGENLIAWSFSDDREIEFKKKCIKRIEELIERIKTHYEISVLNLKIELAKEGIIEWN